MNLDKESCGQPASEFLSISFAQVLCSLQNPQKIERQTHCRNGI